MNCSEVLRYVDVYVDGEFDDNEAARFEGHLDGCRQCSAVVAAEHQFRNTLKTKLPPVGAPDDLRQRIVAQLDGAWVGGHVRDGADVPWSDRRASRGRDGWPEWAVPLAVAAAIAVAIAGTYVGVGTFDPGIDAVSGAAGLMSAVDGRVRGNVPPVAVGPNVSVGRVAVRPVRSTPTTQFASLSRLPAGVRGPESDVRRYMQGRVPFPVSSPLVGSDGMSLVGAKEFVDAGVPAVLWTYDFGGEPVFVIQAVATTDDAVRPERTIRRHGAVTEARFTRRGIRHTVLSELSPRDLGRLLDTRLSR